MKGYIKRNDRGQVGIGTLIVFIALVLVAAIAAGVLINTAGFLQTQAEQTGEDSSDQVSNNINVIGQTGEVDNATNGEINRSRLIVQRAPGSSDVDLTELSIQYVGDNGFENLIHPTAEIGDEDNPSYGDTILDNESAYYGVEVVTADTDTDAVMTDDSDRYQIVIPFNSSVNSDWNSSGADRVMVNDPGIIDSFSGSSLASDAEVAITSGSLDFLETGQQAELTLTTADRATRNAFIQAPDTLDVEDGDTITL